MFGNPLFQQDDGSDSEPAPLDHSCSLLDVVDLEDIKPGSHSGLNILPAEQYLTQHKADDRTFHRQDSASEARLDPQLPSKRHVEPSKPR